MNLELTKREAVWLRNVASTISRRYDDPESRLILDKLIRALDEDTKQEPAA
jgi:hypothetical protein